MSTPEPNVAEWWVTMRPEAIRGCTGDDHPVLLLREVDGPRRVTLRIDESEARRLADEFEGNRCRHSRTYETLETEASASQTAALWVGP